jgi:hypothetical protein
VPCAVAEEEVAGEPIREEREEPARAGSSRPSWSQLSLSSTSFGRLSVGSSSCLLLEASSYSRSVLCAYGSSLNRSGAASVLSLIRVRSTPQHTGMTSRGSASRLAR